MIGFTLARWLIDRILDAAFGRPDLGDLHAAPRTRSNRCGGCGVNVFVEECLCP